LSSDASAERKGAREGVSKSVVMVELVEIEMSGRFMVVEAEEWAGEAIEEDEAEVAAAEAARESSRDFKLLLLLRGLRLRMEPSALLRRRVGVVRPSVLAIEEEEADEAEVAAAEAARASPRDFKLLLLLRGLRLRMEPSALLRRRVGVVRPSVLPVGRPSRPTASWRSLNS